MVDIEFQLWYIERMINLELNKICNVIVEGIDRRDHPKYCDAYIADAWIEVSQAEVDLTPMPSGNINGKNLRQLSEAELDWLNDQSEFVFAQVEKATMP